MVDRMLFFSDAVFAIVLTLLVIELHPPHAEEPGSAAMWRALAEDIPHFIAFLASFALVGLWWLVHMRSTRRLATFDWAVAWTNLLSLMFVTLIPFVSTMLGENFSSASLIVYWGVFAGVGYSSALNLFVMTRGGGRLLSGAMGARERLGRLVQALSPALAFTVGVVLAALGLRYWSVYCWALIAPLYLIGFLIHRAPKALHAPA